MPTVSPQQWNSQDAITSSKLNQPINQLAAVINGGLDDANISSVSGSKINGGTVTVAQFDTNTNPETRMNESLGNYVASGCVVSAGSGLTIAVSAGFAYVNGKRIPVTAVSSLAVPSSKDVYVSVDNTGVVSIASQVANNANSPTQPANTIWLGIAVTGASSVSSVNTGQIGASAPVISGRTLMVTDSNGVLIYPTANQKIIGYAQSTTVFTTTSTTATQVSGLTTTAIIPAGRRVKVSVSVRSAYSSTSGAYNTLSLWSGAVSSGTILMESVYQSQIASGEGPLSFVLSHSPSAGSITYNVGFKVSAGTGNITVGLPAVPMALLVELV